MANATRHTPGVSSFDKIIANSIATGDNVPTVQSVTWTVGAEDSVNVVNVGAQLNDGAGVAMAIRNTLPWYLSADANGDAIASAPSGGIAIGADGLLIETLANQAGFVTSEADGDIDVDITDTTTRTLYMVIVLPNGTLDVSSVITLST